MFWPNGFWPFGFWAVGFWPDPYSHVRSPRITVSGGGRRVTAVGGGR